MKHFAVMDAGADEINNLLNGTKSMIIRGADTKGTPYGIIARGDIVYLVNSDNFTEVRARGIVSSVFNSWCLSEEESYELIIRNQDKLTLPDNLFYKWAGKKYLVLIGLKEVEEIRPFSIEKNTFLTNEGWYSNPAWVGREKYQADHGKGT